MASLVVLLVSLQTVHGLIHKEWGFISVFVTFPGQEQYE